MVRRRCGSAFGCCKLAAPSDVASARRLSPALTHRASPSVLARSPSRDPWRHGCRHRATWTYLQRVLRWCAGKGPAAKAQRRVRGALTARGTRCKYVPGGSLAASMPPTVPQSVRTPHQQVGWWLTRRNKTPHQSVGRCAVESSANDQLDWSLPAHRRGTLGGMDAATELHGRTCSVSREGARARALQQRRSVEGAASRRKSVNPAMPLPFKQATASSGRDATNAPTIQSRRSLPISRACHRRGDPVDPAWRESRHVIRQ
ncbi:hypothetical protein FHR49_003935 [Xanthomonas campestris]